MAVSIDAKELLALTRW